jgi:hypothetical protein
MLTDTRDRITYVMVHGVHRLAFVIVTALGWKWVNSSAGMILTGKHWPAWRKICPGATLYNAGHKRFRVDSNPGFSVKVPRHVGVWLASPAWLGSASNESNSSVCGASPAGIHSCVCGEIYPSLASEPSSTRRTREPDSYVYGHQSLPHRKHSS